MECAVHVSDGKDDVTHILNLRALSELNHEKKLTKMKSFHTVH